MIVLFDFSLVFISTPYFILAALFRVPPLSLRYGNHLQCQRRLYNCWYIMTIMHFSTIKIISFLKFYSLVGSSLSDNGAHQTRPHSHNLHMLKNKCKLFFTNKKKKQEKKMICSYFGSAVFFFCLVSFNKLSMDEFGERVCSVRGTIHQMLIENSKLNSEQKWKRRKKKWFSNELMIMQCMCGMGWHGMAYANAVPTKTFNDNDFSCFFISSDGTF